MNGVEKKQFVLLVYMQRLIKDRAFEYLDNLGLLTVAAYLDSHGVNTKVLNTISVKAVDIIQEHIKNNRLVAVGFYCDYDNQNVIESVSAYLKGNHDTPVVVGGPQARHLGREFLERSRCDLIVRGDGLEAILRYIEQVNTSDIHRCVLPDVAYLLDGEMLSTGIEPLKNNLDELPIPRSRFLLDTQPRQNLSVICARGCPHRCAFCFQGKDSKVFRQRCPDKILLELESRLMEDKKATYVWFADDTFTVGAERVRRICEGLKELQEKRPFIWFAEGHPRKLFRHPEMLKQMIGAGMVRMQIGLESGEDRVLEGYKKDTARNEIAQVVNECRKENLAQLAGNFIIGGACEEERTLKSTCEFAKELLYSAPGIIELSTTFVMPLPNTPISNRPQDFDMMLEKDGYFTSMDDYPVNRTKALSATQIAKARFNIVNEIYSTMKEIYLKKMIPEQSILRSFELMRKGVVSYWMKSVYRKDVLAFAYYDLLSSNLYDSWDKVLQTKNIIGRIPAATIKMDGLKLTPGGLELGGQLISNEEYVLLTFLNQFDSIQMIHSKMEGTLDMLINLIKILGQKKMVLFRKANDSH